MTIEEAILEKLRELPPERQQEVLDFAEFLHQRHRAAYRPGTSLITGSQVTAEDPENSSQISPGILTADENSFTAYVEYDPETNLYVGTIPGIVGAHTQAENLDELQDNLKEVLELCLEEHGGNIENLPLFVGIQRIEVGA